MGIVIRQSVLTTVISYMGVILGFINLLYLYPKFLLPEQIGLLRTIQDAALLLAPFGQLGLAHSIMRFYPHFAQNDDKGLSFINLTLVLSVFGYGLFFLIFMALEDVILSFFVENAKEILNYTHLILWLTFFVMIITLLEYYSRALLKVAFPSLLREIGIRLMQGVLVCLYFTELISFNQFLIFSVGIYLITLVILVSYLVIYGGLRLRLQLSLIPLGKFKEILSFSMLSFIGTSAGILISNMDSIMVSSMKGFSANAIYTTAFYMATVIEIPKRAITQAAANIISRAFEKNDLKEVATIYSKTAINQFIVGALLFIGVWANLHNIFRLIPNGDFYEAGAFVVVIVGAAKLTDMIFGPSSEIIVLSRYYWFNLIVIVILTGTGLVLNLYLIPIYGVLGAAYATGIAIFLFNAIKYVFVYRVLHMQPFTTAFVKVIAIGSLVVLIDSFLPKASNVIIDILYRSILITLIYGTLILLSRSSPELNTIYDRLWKLIKRKM